MRLSANKQKNKAERAALDANALKTYVRLLDYARPHWPMFLLGVVGMVLYASVDTGFAILVKKFLDGAFVQKDPRMLVFVPVGIVVLFLMRGVGDYLSVYAPGWVGRQVIKSIRHDVFARFLQLPVSFFDKNGVAQLLSRLTYNIELVAEAATNAITFIVRDTLTIVGLIGYLIYLNWRLTLFALAVGPLAVFLIRTTSHRFRRYSTRIQASMGDVTRVAKESLESQRMIKVFNAEERQAAIFEQVNERNRSSYMKLITVKAVSNPVVQMLASFGLAAVMYMAIKDVLDKGLSVGEFTSFLAALLMVTAPLRRLVSVIGPLQQGIAAGQSVFEVLDAAAEDKGGELALERARGEVEFRDVSFTYDPEKGRVLTGISFRIAPGETVAVVGRSGSGKSTLVSLLPRFHDPDSGAVLLDGVDIRQYRRRDLRNQLAMVSQDVMLVDDTIANNIAFSAPGADADTRAARGESRARAGVRRGAAAGTRDADRRSGHAALRRAAPARRDRTRDPEGCAGADPGRGDLGARRRVRAPRADRARRAPEGPDHARHRAPPLHDRGRGPHHRHGRGPHRRIRNACRAHRGGRHLRRAAPDAVQRLSGIAAPMGKRLHDWVVTTWYGDTRRGRWLLPLAWLFAAVSGLRRSALRARPLRALPVKPPRRDRRQPHGRRHRQDAIRDLARGRARRSRPQGRRRDAWLQGCEGQCTPAD